MASPLDELWAVLEAAVREGAARTLQGDLDTARDCARQVLSAGSKLHARLGILVDFRNDAAWAGQVDRALGRAREPKPELPGQGDLVAEIKKRQPRKPKSG